MKKRLLILGNCIGMIAFLIYTVIMIRDFLPVLRLLLDAAGFPPEAGAIGIIGGADGPTAVFVSGPHGPFPLVLSLFLLMLLLDVVFIANILYLLKNKK